MESLKSLREKKGLTQSEMAIAVGIGIQTYRNYEYDMYQTMKPDLEKRISDVLGIEYKYPNRKQYIVYNHSKLFKLRKERGLTQQDVALKLGMTVQNYKNYESVIYRNMSSELEKKISNILGVSYKYSEEV